MAIAVAEGRIVGAATLKEAATLKTKQEAVVEAEVVAAEAVEVEPWGPGIHRHWKDPATSITSLDRRPGHVPTDSTVR